MVAGTGSVLLDPTEWHTARRWRPGGYGLSGTLTVDHTR